MLTIDAYAQFGLTHRGWRCLYLRQFFQSWQGVWWPTWTVRPAWNSCCSLPTRVRSFYVQHAHWWEFYVLQRHVRRFAEVVLRSKWEVHPIYVYGHRMPPSAYVQEVSYHHSSLRMFLCAYDIAIVSSHMPACVTCDGILWIVEEVGWHLNKDSLNQQPRTQMWTLYSKHECMLIVLIACSREWAITHGPDSELPFRFAVGRWHLQVRQYAQTPPWCCFALPVEDYGGEIIHGDYQVVLTFFAFPSLQFCLTPCMVFLNELLHEQWRMLNSCLGI